jgi:hypothetical protein
MFRNVKTKFVFLFKDMKVVMNEVSFKTQVVSN